MGVAFTGAGTGVYQTSTVPFTATAPITVGMWFYATSSAAAAATWSITDNSSTLNFFRVGCTGGGVPSLTIRNSTAAAAVNINAGTTGGSGTTGAWTFLIGRFATTASRFIDGIGIDGTVGGATDTSLLVPTMNRMAIGRRTNSVVQEEFTGYIGEFWLCNTDIGATSTTALSTAIIRQLAYNGPFSVPNVSNNLIEYVSFRSRGFFDGGGTIINEYYTNILRNPIDWAVNGTAPTLAVHPPISASYIGPEDFKSTVMLSGSYI